MKKGGDFEAWVAGWVKRAFDGTIQRAEPPFVVMKELPRKGPRRTFQGYFQESGVLDFVGSWGERHIEFDAKDIKGKSFPFSKFNGNQADRLDKMYAGKCRSIGVLIRFRGERAIDDRIYFVPYWLIKLIALKGKKSVNVGECESGAFRITYHTPTRDFEEAIKKCIFGVDSRK